MAIWTEPLTLDKLNAWNQGCAVSHLGIEFTEIGDDFLRAREHARLLTVRHIKTQSIASQLMTVRRDQNTMLW